MIDAMMRAERSVQRVACTMDAVQRCADHQRALLDRRCVNTPIVKLILVDVLACFNMA
jgi:hypothetical protein